MWHRFGGYGAYLVELLSDKKWVEYVSKELYDLWELI
jgi:hypothetical protein